MSRHFRDTTLGSLVRSARSDWRRVPRFLPGLLLAAALAAWTGCSPSTLIARKMMEAPNRVPEFLKPPGRVVLHWPAGMVDRFENGTNIVGPPEAALHWVLIQPMDYQLHESSTVRRRGRRVRAEFDFAMTLPRELSTPTLPVLGTAFVLHGYGVDLEEMFPWGVYLAEAGWRVVLVDLRGHGRSTGKRVYFGTVETNDLVELRTQLEREDQIGPPYVVVGHSMGAALALRWQAVDPDVKASVAFGAPAQFAPAAGRLRSEYAAWIPKGWVRRAARKLPDLMGVPQEALDTTAALRNRPVTAYLVAGEGDVITPPEDSSELRPLLAKGSRFLIVGPITHETLPYAFDRHGQRVLDWLAQFGRGSRRREEADSGVSASSRRRLR